MHAIRNLVRMGFGKVVVRWSQLGFGRTSSTSTAQATPRNLFGFKDGTRNIKAEETAELDRARVGPAATTGRPGSPAGPTWWPGGSACTSRSGTARRCPSRSRSSGATRARARRWVSSKEFDEPDLNVRGADGLPLIGDIAHIRLATKESLGGVRIMRRGYNFIDGSDGLGHLDAGLFFIAFMRDAHKQFVPMQQRAGRQGRDDGVHRAHRVRRCSPCRPGVARGDYWGSGLFT